MCTEGGCVAFGVRMTDAWEFDRLASSMKAKNLIGVLVALFALALPAVADQTSSVLVSKQVTFGVTVSGTAPFTYQWLKDGLPIVNAQAASYVIPSWGIGLEGTYSVRVSNAAGSANSDNGILSTLAITAQPTSARITVASPVSFNVAATGYNLSYQWQKGTTAISGATSPTFSLLKATAADAGAYSVTITSTGTSTGGNNGTPVITVLTSTAALLTVDPLLPPSAATISITTQ